MTYTVEKAANISPCGQYRYWLSRQWELVKAKWLTVIGCNPSTADAEVDDPTIRKTMGFAKLWGYTGLMMLNVYAYRATKPADLWKAADPVGPENDYFLGIAHSNTDVMVAWGRIPKREHVKDVLFRLRGLKFYCLGVNKDGSPKHPLYVPYSAPLTRYMLTHKDL